MSLSFTHILRTTHLKKIQKKSYIKKLIIKKLIVRTIGKALAIAAAATTTSCSEKKIIYLLHVSYIELQEYMPRTQLIFSPPSLTLDLTLLPGSIQSSTSLMLFSSHCIDFLNVRSRVTVTQKIKFFKIIDIVDFFFAWLSEDLCLGVDCEFFFRLTAFNLRT